MTNPLGLKRGTVTIVDYNPDWPRLFDVEKAAIKDAIGTNIIAIEHVGSTAVPGLCAKPILDIAISVASFEAVEDCIQPMVDIGYTYFGDRDNRGDHFFAKGPEESRTVYVHMVKRHSKNWQESIGFRDYLIANPEQREKYGTLKQELAARYPDSRDLYSKAKDGFIETCLGGLR
jgi:GrpB-like predicted nucleotidyltransferase (UPF0157 family)